MKDFVDNPSRESSTVGVKKHYGLDIMEWNLHETIEKFQRTLSIMERYNGLKPS